MNVQVSNNFKKMTSQAIFAIGTFILVYLALLVLAIGLTVLSTYLGLALIVAIPKFITIVLGIGLASLGFLVLIFLFKFLFKKHQIDRSHLIEITRDDEPKLFQFIEEIVNEVETDFPKKIYLSSEVNACVFYDSSFWSMFFPIRKNLQIGLGLVNTISEQEFKAILAHEFGHFSQRSMKVGSYVYNVNQVIFNMLYDNESFDNMIQQWANISGYFSIFVIIAVKIIEGIQWILRKMYEFVNVSYMALSREMEFHADEVAANVAGYLPLKESLLRISLADYSYNSVLSFYNKKLTDNYKSRNIYAEQYFVMNFLAKENAIAIKNNLPLVDELDLNKYNKSKLNIKDQWASHPSTEDRIRALEKLNIIKENSNNNPAIQLFSSPKVIEENITEKLFSSVQYENEINSLTLQKFQEEFTEMYNKNNFAKAYNGYYDDKNILLFDVESITNFEQEETMETLFSKEKVDMVYEYIALENDKNVLTSISNKEYAIKTFDYDGQKYKADETAILIDKLDKALANMQAKVMENDINIYKFFYKKAQSKQNEGELKRKYLDFFKMDKESDQQIELYQNLSAATSFISVVTTFEQIEANFINLASLERELKKGIKALLENELLETEMTKPIKENFETYLSRDWIYFANENYNNENLQIFFAAVNDYNYCNARNYFLKKKELLNYQVE